MATNKEDLFKELAKLAGKTVDEYRESIEQFKVDMKKEDEEYSRKAYEEKEERKLRKKEAAISVRTETLVMIEEHKRKIKRLEKTLEDTYKHTN